ncbi:MAG: flagellar basal body P-ring protein FlgI [Planctomycetaceae bacterium]|nr:flagellar basal body P-ring protein FlgI [Planctomycetaceae bacterium]
MNTSHRTRILMTIALALVSSPFVAYGQNRVKDVCTVKGQERNILRGVGVVVGLQGTGDQNPATTGAGLAEALSKSGYEIPRGASGQALTEIFKADKNATLVIVTAEVPPAGARQGSLIRCQVHAWNSTSSLAGGTLLETSLTGGPAIMSNRDNSRAAALPTLAIASGRIRLEGTDTVTGIIDNGCQLTVDFRNEFFEEVDEVVGDVDLYSSNPAPPGTRRKVRYLNLVVKQAHAEFSIADRIAQQINDELVRGEFSGVGEQAPVLAYAIDSVNIRVRFPSSYYDDPVMFARQILEETPVVLNAKNTKIVLNRRTGVITVGEDVYFSPVAITSGDFKVDIAPFRELSLEDNQGLGNAMKLKRLTQALNDLQAPPSTIIDIITHLEMGGHLYGQVIEQ